MTLFYLVRHGLTSHTGTRLSGRAEGIALSERGAAQAKALGEHLAKVEFAAIYSSPIQRTLETAQAIAAPRKMKVSVDDGLAEVEYGAWTGRTLKSLMRTKLWTNVLRYPSGTRFPDGESIREVQSRAIDALESIRSKHPKGTVCVVSHGDVIRLLLAHYSGVHTDLYQRLHVGAASTSVIALSDGGPRVLAMNIPAPGEALS